MSAALLEVSGLVKDYRGLRPLRIERFSLGAGESAAIVGIDQHAAEAFVNILTGAALPDRGDVRVFGETTAAIEDSTRWLAVVDRFGLFTDRAVLLEPLSVLQNLAIPFSLDIDPVPDNLRSRASALAREVGLDAALWETKVADLNGVSRARLRLGRALALDPAVLLLEHPTATIEPASRAAFGRDVRALAGRRGTATLTLTADADFARLIASRVFVLDLSTGRLSERRMSLFAWRTKKE